MKAFKILNSDSFVDLRNICDSFFPKNTINFFNYFKILKDGTFTCLSNHLDWTEYFFANDLQNHSSFLGKPLVNQQKIFFSDNLTESSCIVKEASQRFSINKTMMIVQPYENYQDVFFFGTDNPSTAVFGTFINQLDLFQRFIFYFREKGQMLLSKANYINLESSSQLYPPINEIQIPSPEVTRYYLSSDPGEPYLTRREVECIGWLAKGKSMEEIGLILDISNRTVEQHIDNVKKKMGHYKQSAIIYRLTKMGILK